MEGGRDKPLNYCRDCLTDNTNDTHQIDDLMYILDQISDRYSSWIEPEIRIPKHILRGFDDRNLEGAPNFVVYLESAVETAKK